MKWFLFLFFLLISSFSFSQTISGVINSYLRVTAVDIPNRQFTSDNLYGNISDFQVGKSILIYQAKGANIETTNNSDYGTITDYNEAGNYEFAKVESITGSDPYIITVTILENTYSAGGSVQLVSVPEYEDVTVTSTVTSTPWDATSGRGGIVVFEVADELTLGADIDVSGQGFEGGSISSANGDCPDASTYTTTNTGYAGKGEGITTDGNAYARGPRANGGGGGNPHNAGGGGGSNFTYGGDGGEGYQLCEYQNAGGLTGKSIDYASLTDKIFFGGGGGAGQQNNSLASAGGNGGGIIIIRAETIISDCENTYGIYADGVTADDSGGNDGAGGGGAGGSIVLDVLNFNNTCNISINAHGGNGGTVNTSSSHGGGGGGGIGVVMQVYPTSSTFVTIQSNPGNNGLDCNSGCDTPSGTAHETPISSKMSITEIPGILITLPIKLVSFKGNLVGNRVQLTWVTASEWNNDYFTLERSQNGKDFIAFKTIKGAGNSNNSRYYTSEDRISYNNCIIYYRLKQTDYDGQFSYSDIIQVLAEVQQESAIQSYPNPASQWLNLVNLLDGPTYICIKNCFGNVMNRQNVERKETIDVSSLKAGLYVLESVHNNIKSVQKIMIKH